MQVDTTLSTLNVPADLLERAANAGPARTSSCRNHPNFIEHCRGRLARALGWAAEPATDAELTAAIVAALQRELAIESPSSDTTHQKPSAVPIPVCTYTD